MASRKLPDFKGRKSVMAKSLTVHLPSGSRVHRPRPLILTYLSSSKNSFNFRPISRVVVPKMFPSFFVSNRILTRSLRSAMWVNLTGKRSRIHDFIAHLFLCPARACPSLLQAGAGQFWVCFWFCQSSKSSLEKDSKPFITSWLALFHSTSIRTPRNQNSLKFPSQVRQHFVVWNGFLHVDFAVFIVFCCNFF